MATYGGKDAVENEGRGNYYPIARRDWYPNNVAGRLSQYVTYDRTFRIPKGMKMAATGIQVSESNDGGQSVTVWKSAVPQPLAGFNFGRFKMEEAKLNSPEYLVQAYVNEEPPDDIKYMLEQVNKDSGNWRSRDNPTGAGAPGTGHHGSGYAVALGHMETTPLLEKALAEAQLAVHLYPDYFCPAHVKQLAVTQHWACNYCDALQ